MEEDTDRDIIDEDFYDEDDEDTQKDRYLTFHLGGEVYGIEIYYVIEIVGMHRITGVPDMPEFVKGVINLRGQIIPIMDVRARFHMEPLEYNDRTCVIVVQLDENTIGLVVDTVDEVAVIPSDNIAPPPTVGRGAKSHYIQGMGKTGDEVKILLDVNKLLFEEELAMLSDHPQE
ncbi:MAG: purine-binding chemotaxis protein CheW [Desulfobacterales bacterium]|nr:purine-binding chemotaxis protein CheW [Desulfobacterales bacterium]